MRWLKMIFVSLFIIIIISCSPEETEIIVNNEVATSTLSGIHGKKVVLYVDGNEEGVIDYNSSKSVDLDEGDHTLRLSAAPDQGLLWWTEAEFHLSEGETIEFTATLDGLTWRSN